MRPAFKRGHQIETTPLIKNYFWWIANLGVEPLFLFFAFLLAPEVCAFLALLVSVAFVFETIVPLQSKLAFYNYILVPVMLLLVKGASATVVEQGDIIIGKGEHREIIVGKLNKFTISNKESVSYQYNDKNGTLLLKGKSVGFSELYMVKEKGVEESKKIFVVSKQKQMQIAELSQNLNSIGLSSKQSGEILMIEGEITDKKSYLLFHKILKEEKLLTFSKAKLGTELRNTLIAEIYQSLYDHYVDQVHCFEKSTQINCEYQTESELPKELIEYLKNEYAVLLLPRSMISVPRNYRAKIKLIQIEKLDGSEVDLGLTHLSGNLGELFSIGPAAMIARNALNLSKENIHVSTLAEPENVILVGEESSVRVGAEIPYQTKDKDGNSETSWKFAGLKVNLKLQKVGGSFKVNFETEFTTPLENGAVGGSKEKSSVNLTLSKPFEVFKINFRTVGKKSNSFPLLSSIPILGEIFRSKSEQETYKNITGVILLESYDAK